ncbi:hypothetical protein V8D89_002528 [Ganoderma adspersum]
MAHTTSNGSPSKSRSRISNTVYENEVMVTRFACPICSVSVARKGDLNRHMRVHTGEGLVYCLEPGCTHEDGFTQKSNLDQHVKSVHLGKRHRCPHLWVDAGGTEFECGETFADPSGLISHRSRKHGFDHGDNPAKVLEPTPVGTKFPDSKYAHKSKAVAGPSSSSRVSNTKSALPVALHPSASAYPACPPIAPRDAPIADAPAGQLNTLTRLAAPAPSAFEHARRANAGLAPAQAAPRDVQRMPAGWGSYPSSSQWPSRQS